MITLVDRDLIASKIEGFQSALQDLACSCNTYTSPVMVYDDACWKYTIFDQDGYPLGYIGVNANTNKISKTAPQLIKWLDDHDDDYYDEDENFYGEDE